MNILVCRLHQLTDFCHIFRLSTPYVPLILRHILGCASSPTFLRHILGCASSPTFLRSSFAEGSVENNFEF